MYPKPRALDVLIVDDHPTNRLILTRTAELFGCRTQTADDGAEALQMLGERRFGLVFMDIAMPVMDGLQATKLARSRGVDAPVVAVTAYYSESEFWLIRDLGFDGLITKPIKIHEVRDTISRFS